jgi:hypothetical protein
MRGCFSYILAIIRKPFWGGEKNDQGPTLSRQDALNDDPVSKLSKKEMAERIADFISKSRLIGSNPIREMVSFLLFFRYAAPRTRS